MKKNTVIRERAFRLSWRHRGLLLTIFFIFAVVNLLWYAARTYLIENYYLESLLSIAYQLVTAPVMSLGLIHLLLRLTKRGEARWPMLFDFVRFSKEMPKVFSVSFFYIFPSFIFLVIDLFSLPAMKTQAQYSAFLILLVPVFCFVFWLDLRLFLLPYLFVLNPGESAAALMKLSFQRMRGRVRHLIWFGITVYWWSFALFAVILLLVPSLSFVKSSGSSQPVRQLITTLIMALFNPYFCLAFAGYVNELLVSEKKMR